MTEQEIAIMEAEQIHACDTYFKARPQIDTDHNRHVFNDGFERGYKVDNNERT